MTWKKAFPGISVSVKEGAIRVNVDTLLQASGYSNAEETNLKAVRSVLREVIETTWRDDQEMAHQLLRSVMKRLTRRQGLKQIEIEIKARD